MSKSASTSLLFEKIIENKPVNEILELLEGGAKIDATFEVRGEEGLDLMELNPVELAAYHGRTKILQTLINKGGVSLDSKAITVAAQRGNMEVVTLLLNNGGTQLDQEEVAKVLLQKGSENIDGEFYTQFEKAALEGHSLIVNLLLRYRGDVKEDDLTEPDNSYPLLLASSGGHLAIVNKLLKLGVNIESSNDDGWTSLMLAANGGHSKATSSLLECGADVNASIGGWTPLMMAAYNGHENVVDLILEKRMTKGFNIDAVNEESWNSLMFAAYYGNEKIVKSLLWAGADLEAINSEGKNAMEIAQEVGNLKISEAINSESEKRSRYSNKFLNKKVLRNPNPDHKPTSSSADSLADSLIKESRDAADTSYIHRK